jgi:hypothetical protein
MISMYTKGKGPRMYCSRPLDNVEHILFYVYMEAGKATSKNGVKHLLPCIEARPGNISPSFCCHLERQG